MHGHTLFLHPEEFKGVFFTQPWVQDKRFRTDHDLTIGVEFGGASQPAEPAEWRFPGRK